MVCIDHRKAYKNLTIKSKRMDKLQQQILAAQNSGQPLSEDVQKEYQ